MASGNDRRHSIKKLIAGLLSAAIFWLILPDTSPTNFNNQEPSGTKPTVKATAEPAMQRAEAIPVKTEPVGETATVEEVAVKPQPTPAPQTPPSPGSKEEMMTAAGIPTSDWAAVDYIVHHESTWRPSVVNASSGSCGLVQELPCGKSGCTLGDGVCQLRWATQYATSRYGSWTGAMAFWQSNRWW